MPDHEDVAVVQRYFSHWAHYRSAVEHDYIHHEEMTAAVNEEIRRRGYAGDLLDLGCGDAAPVIAMVDGVGVRSYTGMDVTAAALDLARRNLTWVQGPVTLLVGDFAVDLAAMTGEFDTVIVSLAMHHLPHDDKPAFFAAAHERLAPGGVLFLYEPACLPGEGREDYVARQSAFFRSQFTAMTAAAVDDLNTHVREADFPESPGTYAGMALDAGFADASVLFVDPQHFWALLALRT